MPLKIEMMTFRLEPGINRMLRDAAEWECRSISNMIQEMVEYAKKMEIEENHNKRKRKAHSKLN